MRLPTSNGKMLEVNLRRRLPFGTKKVVADVGDLPERIMPEGIVARLVLGVIARHTHTYLIWTQHGPIYIRAECLLKLLPTPAFTLPGPGTSRPKLVPHQARLCPV